ncbi:MAG: hypothetical protein KKD44_28325 [Proteobacteria bacterium]|nr:hypothetical protein [Pseudomonadota bacterium]
MSKRQQRAQSAYSAGKEAGMKGIKGIKDNPYPKGHEYHNVWRAGYLKG